MISETDETRLGRLEGQMELMVQAMQAIRATNAGDRLPSWEWGRGRSRWSVCWRFSLPGADSRRIVMTPYLP